MTLFIHLLRNGGRPAVVLPDGFLFGEGMKNYNLDIKNPHVGEQVSHDPDELLAKYEQQLAESQEIRQQLRGILADALGNTGAGGEA